MSIFYKESNGKAVQAVLRVKKPGALGFDPGEVVKEWAAVLKEYGISTVTGDRYSAEWCSSAFQKEGIFYKNSEMNKSQIYSEFLPILMTGAVELLDHKPMLLELRSLERRTGKGRDSIDHAPGAHDDCANVAALGAVLAAKETIRDNTVLEKAFSPVRSLTGLEAISADFQLRVLGESPDSARRMEFEAEEEARAELAADEEANRRELAFDAQVTRTFHGWKP